MKRVVFLAMVFVVNLIFSQNEIHGIVVDHQSVALSGANIEIQGAGKGDIADFDGEFSIKTKKESGNIRISYIGFQEKIVSFNFAGKQVLDLGEIVLDHDDNALAEVTLVGKGVIDLVRDRQTPIASSSVTREEIQLKAVGNVEFPNVMKNTPSVYVSNESGGFGDSQVFVRGFDQTNTAFLLNGQPVNGMEDGKLYWSNWSGITDIANVVQIQRGLGSSKLAISSVGGTINMVTKATARHQGGFARFLVGNDSYMKATVSYDTGMNDNGWGFSFLLDYWQAHAKYPNGTRGRGQNYFFSVGKKAGDHNFNLLITGAPQQHDQNFSKSQQLYDRYGRQYNNNYGFYKGNYLTSRRNYYHKPIINLNWDWDIDQKQNLSSVIYASFGRGGGTGGYGRGLSDINYPKADNDALQSGPYKPLNGVIDWNYVAEVNNNITDRFSRADKGTLLRASVNNHQWYGGVFNYENNKIKNISINVGADLRFYSGTHFRQLTEKLGLKGRIENFAGDPHHKVTKTYSPNPWAALFNYASKDDRLNYDYTEFVNYQGGFGQVEWANDAFSAFVQGAVSNQSYKKEDRGNFEQVKKSNTLNKVGYDIKAGVSWRFLEDNKIYLNTGKYSRQPFLDDIFRNTADQTEIADPQPGNEEILGLEAGYSFYAGDFELNLNAYYTQWKNRLMRTTGTYDPNGNDMNPQYPDVAYLFMDISELHKGIELDANWKPIPDMKIHGYTTFGDWTYDGSTPVLIRDNQNNENIDELRTDLQDTKVGQAPQVTAGLGVDYEIIKQKLNAYVSWNYFTDFYGFVDVEDAALSFTNGVDYQSEKLNSYSLVDIGGSYRFYLGDQQFQVAGNVYNVFNHYYISQRDNYGYYLGNGITYNFSVKYFF